MAEGGQLPWKCQVVDMSRGPAADYSAIHRPLPPPPTGVVWQRDEQTREYKLVRMAVDDALAEKRKRKYKLQLGTTWNPHTGREVATLVSVPKEQFVKVEEEQQEVVDDVAEDSSSSDNKKEENQQPLIENIDYMVHTVLPSDTLAGLCLRYKVRATTLRQINQFSGSNLGLAPSKLIIPLNDKKMDHVRPQDTSSPEYKLQALLAEFPHLQAAERRAYLELNDWDLEATIREIKEDEAWEREQKQQQQKMKNNETVDKPSSTTHHKQTPQDISTAVPVNDTWKWKEDEFLHEKSSLTTPLLVPSELEMARTRLK